MAKSLRPPAQGDHSQLTSRLGYQLPERIIGIHLNMLAVRRDFKMLENPTAEEKTFLGELNHFLKEETGYQWIQGTKPTTLAFELRILPLASPLGSSRNSIVGRTTRGASKRR